MLSSSVYLFFKLSKYFNYSVYLPVASFLLFGELTFSFFMFYLFLIGCNTSCYLADYAPGSFKSAALYLNGITNDLQIGFAFFLLSCLLFIGRIF